jgi:hypothetical protein
VLRSIFGHKTENVAGGCRRLHNEELHNLYVSPNFVSVIKSRRLRWAGHIELMGEIRHAYKILEGKSEGKGPHGRPGYRWEDNIKLNFRECGGKVWTGFIWLEIGSLSSVC